MSLLLKNELRLSVAGLDSSATLWRAGWTARCTAIADTLGGDGPDGAVPPECNVCYRERERIEEPYRKVMTA